MVGKVINVNIKVYLYALLKSNIDLLCITVSNEQTSGLHSAPPPLLVK